MLNDNIQKDLQKNDQKLNVFKTRKRIVKSNRKRNDDGVLVGSEKENRLEMLPREPFENALYKEKGYFA